jgi:hypothetical protein
MTDNSDFSQIEHLKQYVDYITYPPNFVKYFETDEEFIEWCKLGTKDELENLLNIFREYKLDDHCILIFEVLQEYK